MSRKILFVHPDLFVLAGNLRAMLMLADTALYLGHDIKFLYTDLRPPQDRYWTLPKLKYYHPVKYLTASHFEATPHKYLSVRIYDWMSYEDYDIWITDEGMLLYEGASCPVLHHIHYVHYPDRPNAPREIAYAFNSKFTALLARQYWDVKGYVMWPPIWPEFYKQRSYEDRDIDIVFFGQLYLIKGFDIAEKLAEEGFEVVVVGADVEDWKPKKQNRNLRIFKNLTVYEYTEILSRSKVYVHARPGEHFGITIVEAMASATPPIVHRSGGQWTDISEYGRYTMSWSNYEELLKNVKILLENRRVWEDWSYRAVKRAEYFTVENLAPIWNYILEREITNRYRKMRSRN